MLQDRIFFLQCNPHMEKSEVVGEVHDPSLPGGLKALGPTTAYRVVDNVGTLPKGIWGSTVESTYEFTDIELGLFARIKSPLSVVMDTVWEIRESDRGLELVEDATIKCSRLLIGVVKSLTEGGCKLIPHPTLPIVCLRPHGPCPRQSANTCLANALTQGQRYMPR